jgi:hypothetical protein
LKTNQMNKNTLALALAPITLAALLLSSHSLRQPSDRPHHGR